MEKDYSNCEIVMADENTIYHRFPVSDIGFRYGQYQLQEIYNPRFFGNYLSEFDLHPYHTPEIFNQDRIPEDNTHWWVVTLTEELDEFCADRENYYFDI